MWWIDTSYNTHKECQGHTGVMMSLGQGDLLGSSPKQILMVKSLTVGDIVYVHGGLGVLLWCKYFVEKIGYTM